MQDNYEVAITIRAAEPWLNTSSPCTNTYNASDPCFLRWQSNGTGPYADSPGFFFVGRTSVSWDSDSDMFYLSAPSWQGAGFVPGYSNAIPHPNFWGTSLVRMQTANPSGTVKLRSADPRIAPAINFNFFEQNRDIDLQALTESAELLLRGYNETGIPYELVHPSPHVDMVQGIMDGAFSHHATSSCRMGPANATGAEACVDSKFRVKGVKALRIVDASVWPRVPGAFVNAPTFTMSTKAIDVIFNEE